MDPIRTGIFITRMRQDRGRTLRQLAGRIGVSPEMLAACEDGSAVPRSEVLIRLGRVLEMGVLAVMRGVYPPIPPIR